MQCISLGYWLPDVGVTFISHVLHNSPRLAQCNGSVPSNRAPSLFFLFFIWPLAKIIWMARCTALRR